MKLASTRTEWVGQSGLGRRVHGSPLPTPLRSSFPPHTTSQIYHQQGAQLIQGYNQGRQILLAVARPREGELIRTGSAQPIWGARSSVAVLLRISIGRILLRHLAEPCSMSKLSAQVGTAAKSSTDFKPSDRQLRPKFA